MENKKDEDAEPTGLWSVLSTEIVILAFSFLSLKDLATCLLVNKHFNTIANEDTLWKAFASAATTTTKPLDEGSVSWKEIVRTERDVGAWKKRWAEYGRALIFHRWRPESECCAW